MAYVVNVAYLLTVAVDRPRLASQSIVNATRNEFLGKVMRPIVVRAVSGGDGRAVSGTRRSEAALLAQYGLLGSKRLNSLNGASSRQSDP